MKLYLLASNLFSAIIFILQYELYAYACFWLIPPFSDLHGTFPFNCYIGSDSSSPIALHFLPPVVCHCLCHAGSIGSYLFNCMFILTHIHKQTQDVLLGIVIN